MVATGDQRTLSFTKIGNQWQKWRWISAKWKKKRVKLPMTLKLVQNGVPMQNLLSCLNAPLHLPWYLAFISSDDEFCPMIKAHPHFSKVDHLKSRSQVPELNQKITNNELSTPIKPWVLTSVGQLFKKTHLWTSASTWLTITYLLIF